MYVCICDAVTDDEVRAAVTGGASTLEEVGKACGAGTGCGSCHERIKTLLPATSPAPSVVAA